MKRMDRRHFLCGSGLGVALPMLDSFSRRTDADDEKSLGGKAISQDGDEPELRRMVCVGTYLGFHQRDFFPETAGRQYQMPPILESVSQYREKMSILSGLDHRGRNGHEGWKAWMTGNASGSISMDELVAGHVGNLTRYASLQLTCGTPPSDARLSFTKEGVALPMIGRPSVLYQTLFRSGSDRTRIDALLRSNRSVLDGLLEETESLSRQLGSTDRKKLNEYLASLRDVERRLQKQQTWLNKPTPKVEYELPEFDPVAPDLALECESIIYALMALALSSDSTRVITFLVPGWSQVFKIDGRLLRAGYHGLSHHGNEPEKIADYNLIGIEHVKRLGHFLDKITNASDRFDRPLIDTTAVVFGSGMGDSNTHDNSNLPTLLVGGPFRHGRHHAIDRRVDSSKRLGDLYLTLMRRFGIDIESFAGASQNMDELI